jgi:hypothetical protein
VSAYGLPSTPSEIGVALPPVRKNLWIPFYSSHSKMRETPHSVRLRRPDEIRWISPGQLCNGVYKQTAYH